MPFKKGKSGNPNGRPPKKIDATTITHNILSKFSEDEILAQLRKLQVLGENGDISAIRVFLSYFLCSADKLMEVKNIPDIQLTDEKALAIRKIIES